MAHQNLVISAIGADQKGIIQVITQCIAQHECNLLDSHITVMGEEFTMTCYIAGNWNTLTRLEKALSDLQDKQQVSIATRRTGPAKPKPTMMPYMVDVTAVDRPGIVYELTRYFNEHNIYIAELTTRHYLAPGTQAKMFAASIIIHIDLDSSVTELRDTFSEFCEEKNLEAFLEPQRN